MIASFISIINGSIKKISAPPSGGKVGATKLKFPIVMMSGGGLYIAKKWERYGTKVSVSEYELLLAHEAIILIAVNLTKGET